MSKTSEIKFNVTVDENFVPEKIEWQASDNQEKGISNCKAAMISLWDEAEKNTLRIDLWTKEMMIDEMKQFFFQTLMTMSDTYERATGEKDIADEIRAFGSELAQKMKNKNS
ncbi:MAG: gliding motility protein GldC [Vicingaceae bacterium]|jgi:gliding motility-associated protein GldC